MGVIPVRTLNSIKRDRIGGVANDPVIFWILRNGLADRILGKRLTFLAENFQSKCSIRNSTSLPLTFLLSEIQSIMTTTSTTIAMTKFIAIGTITAA